MFLERRCAINTYSIKIYTMSIEIVEYIIKADRVSDAKRRALAMYHESYKGGYRKIISKKIVDNS